MKLLKATAWTTVNTGVAYERQRLHTSGLRNNRGLHPVNHLERLGAREREITIGVKPERKLDLRRGGEEGGGIL